MKRLASYIGGGLLTALALAAFAPSIAGISAARSASFDARWNASEPARKQDRVAAPRASDEGKLLSYQDVAAQMTVVIKVPAAPPNAGRNPPWREIPQGSMRKQKLPDGCEPSFSPVTVPSMAHITGRCVV
jgi:hypothetical protein